MSGKKAKTVTLFFSLIWACNALYAQVRIPESRLCEKMDLDPNEDELISLQRIIDHTEKRQKAQERLKFLLVELKKNKEQFLQGEPNKIHAWYMIKAAHEGLEIIKQYNLHHLFTSDFIEELAVLNQVGNRDSPAL